MAKKHSGFIKTDREAGLELMYGPRANEPHDMQREPKSGDGCVEQPELDKANKQRRDLTYGNS